MPNKIPAPLLMFEMCVICIGQESGFLKIPHRNLLPLAFGVEHGALFDACLGGEAGDDALALLAAVPMDHRVEVVGPVGAVVRS